MFKATCMFNCTKKFRQLYFYIILLEIFFAQTLAEWASKENVCSG